MVGGDLGLGGSLRRLELGSVLGLALSGQRRLDLGTLGVSFGLG